MFLSDMSENSNHIINSHNMWTDVIENVLYRLNCAEKKRATK